MELKEFLKKFFVHLALAGAFWYLIVLTLERLLPGFIAPFLNLPVIGLLVFLLCVTASVYGTTANRRSRVLLAGIVILAISLLWFWTRISNLGISGLALEISGILLGIICVHSLYQKEIK